MIEHLLNCHPIIYTLLSKLYYCMLVSGYVPSAFGQGIMIPLPKSDNLNGSHRIDSFRGIAISPAFSKVFEHW